MTGKFGATPTKTRWRRFSMPMGVALPLVAVATAALARLVSSTKLKLAAGVVDDAPHVCAERA